MRYKIKKSTQLAKGWVVTDTQTGIVCVFEQHRFNETKRFTQLEDSTATANELARAMSEMGEWLAQNHYFLAMPVNRDIYRRELGQYIRRLREEAGMTLQELADLAGIGRSHLNTIELGRYNFTIDILHQLAEALGRKIELNLK